MAAAEWGGAARIAGRAREQELLRQVVGGSVHGVPCTVLVHGEAGVGKTRLVTSVAERSRASGHSVLWARCLRFGAGSSPYLPFISAFEGWLAEGHPDEGLDLTPLYGGSGATTAARALHVIDRAVAHLAEQGPVVLAVDDLQWADVELAGRAGLPDRRAAHPAGRAAGDLPRRGDPRRARAAQLAGRHAPDARRGRPAAGPADPGGDRRAAGLPVGRDAAGGPRRGGVGPLGRQRLPHRAAGP